MSPDEYLSLRYQIVELGFDYQIAWAETVSEPGTAEEFAREYIFVVCNSGMKAQIARAIFERVMEAIFAGRHPSEVFGHRGKADAIWEVWQSRHLWFNKYLSVPDTEMVDFFETMPWIGGITKWHLAKNCGADVVKPDRHLVRVAEMYQTTPDDLCRTLAAVTGDRIGTVDYVIWQCCNLGIIRPKRQSSGE